MSETQEPTPAPEEAPAPPAEAPPAEGPPPAPEAEAEEEEAPYSGPTFEYQYVGVSAADHAGVTSQLNELGAKGWEICAADLSGGTFRILLMRESPEN